VSDVGEGRNGHGDNKCSGSNLFVHGNDLHIMVGFDRLATHPKEGAKE
jgi:hypothetical protein